MHWREPCRIRCHTAADCMQPRTGERHQVDQLHLESGTEQDRTPEGAIRDVDFGGIAASYFVVVGAAALTCSHSLLIVTPPRDIPTFLCVPACLAYALPCEGPKGRFSNGDSRAAPHGFPIDHQSPSPLLVDAAHTDLRGRFISDGAAD